MPLGKLLGRAYIDELHLLALNLACKLFGIDRPETWIWCAPNQQAHESQHQTIFQSSFHRFVVLLKDTTFSAITKKRGRLERQPQKGIE